MGKTRKNKKPEQIQHHHLIIRCETELCPEEHDKGKMEHIIDDLIKEINMTHLAPAKVYYMKTPAINEGMTAIAPIATSHISFHFWKRPNRSILNNKASKCLLQMDVYTCGSLSSSEQRSVLGFLETFKPTHLNLTLLNRLRGMIVDKVISWDRRNQTFNSFLKNI